MNKTELVKKVAAENELTQKSAAAVVDSVLNSIMDSTALAKQKFPDISKVSFVLYAGKPKRAFRNGGIVHPNVALCRRERGMP